MGVEAGVRDELVQPGQSGRVDDALAAEDVRGVLVGSLLHHRHDHLARDVAAHHDGVDTVELPGVQELPQAQVGTVDVGGEEDLRVFHAPPTSSGSSYHGVLRPTTLRALQRMDLGAARSDSSIASARASTIDASSGSSRSAAASRTSRRLSVTVVNQPQSDDVTDRSRSSDIASGVPAAPPMSAFSWVSSRRTASTRSLRLISWIWSLVSRRSAASRLYACCPSRPERSSRWHIENTPTNTSTWRLFSVS